MKEKRKSNTNLDTDQFPPGLHKVPRLKLTIIFPNRKKDKMRAFETLIKPPKQILLY